MSDNNLFSFPGESCGQTGSDIFSSGGFVDLGSADDGDNPFADMTADTPAAEECSEYLPALSGGMRVW